MANKAVGFILVIPVATTAVAIALLCSQPCSALSGVSVPRIQPIGDFPNANTFRLRKEVSLMSTLDPFNVTVSSDVVSRLVAGQRFVVNVTVASVANLTEPAMRNRTPGYFLLRANASNVRVLRLVNGSRHSWTTATGLVTAVSLVLEGVDVGYSFVRFSVDDVQSNNTLRSERDDILVSVVRPVGLVNVISDVFLLAVPIISQVAMGSQVDMDIIKGALRRPKPLIAGLLCQYTIMPLLSYGLLMAMQWRGGIALGFFALGCAPGGGLSNLFTVLLGGDITLSMVLTLQSTLFALGFVPLWMFTLGATLPGEDGIGPIRIPFANMAISLAITIGPVFVGLFIKFKLPRIAAFIGNTMKPVFLVVVLAAYALLLYVNSFVFAWFDAALVLAASSLPIGGFLISLFMAYAIRLKWKIIKTIAIETGIQSAIVAGIIVNQSLEKPAADLALIPVTAAGLVGPLPLVAASAAYTVYWKVVDIRHKKKIAEAAAWLELNGLEISLEKKKQTEAAGSGTPAAEIVSGATAGSQGILDNQEAATSLSPEIKPSAEVFVPKNVTSPLE